MCHFVFVGHNVLGSKIEMSPCFYLSFKSKCWLLFFMGFVFYFESKINAQRKQFYFINIYMFWTAFSVCFLHRYSRFNIRIQTFGVNGSMCENPSSFPTNFTVANYDYRVMATIVCKSYVFPKLPSTVRWKSLILHRHLNCSAMLILWLVWFVPLPSGC